MASHDKHSSAAVGGVIALFTLTSATRIFAAGTKPPTPNYYRWSNGPSTLVFNVFPDAMTQSFTSDDPDIKFDQRILDYLLITLYLVVIMVVFVAAVDHLGAWRVLSARHEGDAKSDQVLSRAG